MLVCKGQCLAHSRYSINVNFLLSIYLPSVNKNTKNEEKTLNESGSSFLCVNKEGKCDSKGKVQIDHEGVSVEKEEVGGQSPGPLQP